MLLSFTCSFFLFFSSSSLVCAPPRKERRSFRARTARLPLVCSCLMERRVCNKGKGLRAKNSPTSLGVLLPHGRKALLFESETAPPFLAVLLSFKTCRCDEFQRRKALFQRAEKARISSLCCCLMEERRCFRERKSPPFPLLCCCLAHNPAQARPRPCRPVTIRGDYGH